MVLKISEIVDRDQYKNFGYSHEYEMRGLIFSNKFYFLIDLNAVIMRCLN